MLPLALRKLTGRERKAPQIYWTWAERPRLWLVCYLIVLRVNQRLRRFGRLCKQDSTGWNSRGLFEDSTSPVLFRHWRKTHNIILYLTSQLRFQIDDSLIQIRHAVSWANPFGVLICPHLPPRFRQRIYSDRTPVCLQSERHYRVSNSRNSVRENVLKSRMKTCMIYCHVI
jgi:hypothetical protein